MKNIEHRFKLGELVKLQSTESDLFGPISVPIAIRQGGKLSCVMDTDKWMGILANQRIYFDITKTPIYGIAIGFEEVSEMTDIEADLELDYTIITPPLDRRMFVLISKNNEPEYVRVIEDAHYVHKVEYPCKIE